jgi:hypothetical protein
MPTDVAVLSATTSNRESGASGYVMMTAPFSEGDAFEVPYKLIARTRA